MRRNEIAADATATSTRVSPTRLCAVRLWPARRGPVRPCPGRLSIALATAVTAIAAAPTAAQENSWELRAGYERQVIDSELPHWTDWERWSAEARYHFDGGSVAVDGFQNRRFGIDDQGAALDAYLDFAERTYVHARAGFAPDARVLARQDHRLDVYHATPGGWEGSVGYRYLDVVTDDIHVLSASLARYLPGWYLRARGDLNPSFDENALFGSVSIRRFLASVDGYAQLSTGAGEEVVEVAAGPEVDIRTSRFVSGRVKAFPWATVGLTVDLSLHDLEGLPRRTSVGAGIIVRW